MAATGSLDIPKLATSPQNTQEAVEVTHIGRSGDKLGLGGTYPLPKRVSSEHGLFQASTPEIAYKFTILSAPVWVCPRYPSETIWGTTLPI